MISPISTDVLNQQAPRPMKSGLLTKKIESLNMKVHDTRIRMTNKKTEDALGSFLLKQINN